MRRDDRLQAPGRPARPRRSGTHRPRGSAPPRWPDTRCPPRLLGLIMVDLGTRDSGLGTRWLGLVSGLRWSLVSGLRSRWSPCDAGSTSRRRSVIASRRCPIDSPARTWSAWRAWPVSSSTPTRRISSRGSSPGFWPTPNRSSASTPTGIEPTSHAPGSGASMRDDVVLPSLPREASLAAAPDADVKAGLFKVPRVMG